MQVKELCARNNSLEMQAMRDKVRQGSASAAAACPCRTCSCGICPPARPCGTFALPLLWTSLARPPPCIHAPVSCGMPELAVLVYISISATQRPFVFWCLDLKPPFQASLDLCVPFFLRTPANAPNREIDAGLHLHAYSPRAPRLAFQNGTSARSTPPQNYNGWMCLSSSTCAGEPTIRRAWHANTSKQDPLPNPTHAPLPAAAASGVCATDADA